MTRRAQAPCASPKSRRCVTTRTMARHPHSPAQTRADADAGDAATGINPSRIEMSRKTLVKLAAALKTTPCALAGGVK